MYEFTGRFIDEINKTTRRVKLTHTEFNLLRHELSDLVMIEDASGYPTIAAYSVRYNAPEKFEIEIETDTKDISIDVDIVPDECRRSEQYLAEEDLILQTAAEFISATHDGAPASVYYDDGQRVIRLPYGSGNPEFPEVYFYIDSDGDLHRYTYCL